MLLRHAKAAVDDGRGDFARPLTERGRRDARQVGQGLPVLNHAIDHVLCSPALRARQTLDAVLAMAGLCTPVPIYDDRLYLASREELVAVLASLPDDLATVLVVGHNPGLEDLLHDLVQPGASIGPMKTAHLALLAALDEPPRLVSGRWRLEAWLSPRDGAGGA